MDENAIDHEFTARARARQLRHELGQLLDATQPSLLIRVGRVAAVLRELLKDARRPLSRKEHFSIATDTLQMMLNPDSDGHRLAAALEAIYRRFPTATDGELAQCVVHLLTAVHADP